MNRDRRPWLPWIGALMAFFIVLLGTSAPARELWRLPSRLELIQGQETTVPWSRFLPLSVTRPAPALSVGREAQTLALSASRLGHYRLDFRWFGWIRWRELPVDVMRPIMVVPGGESLGVMVHFKGLVVSHLVAVNVGGDWREPAAQAGLERGDVIRAVDGLSATSVAVLAHRVQIDGRQHHKVLLRVAGARTVRNRWVTPVWSAVQHAYAIGVAVRQQASGVGTLTFYDPKTGAFAALGHSMTDGLTRRPLDIQEGYATGADIVGIVPATDAEPGQKVGVLSGPTNISGPVTKNGEFGLVGRLNHAPVWGPRRAMPVALPDQVRPGPAQIITVVHGEQPEVFQIDILKAKAQSAPEIKGLLFRVTDPRLIRIAGGIVQGMSGSPIIQQGRVVGAVTHVLVSRPTLGFGCYAYWMVTQPGFR
ncbi:MAG: SpoIVB peptidase [Firmicutes bacterium]|nr:SpoIVB peptidase [Bacillota bacterium]